MRHSSEQLEDLTAKNDAAPACPLPELDDFDKRTGPEILIDKTGVADPECIITVTHDVNKYMFVYTPRVGDSAQRAANDNDVGDVRHIHDSSPNWQYKLESQLQARNSHFL